MELPSPTASPPPKRLALRFNGREVEVTPGRTRAYSYDALVQSYPEYTHMCPVVLGGQGGSFVDDDAAMTSDVELGHSLNAAPAEAQPSVKKLVVTMESTVDALVTRRTCLMEPAAALRDPDDDSELAAQVLFNEFVNAVSAMVNANEIGSGGRPRGFHVCAARGGVVLVGDTITLASVFIGPSIPTKAIFQQMVNPGSRSLQDAPVDQQYFLGRLKWWTGGGQELSAPKSPAKVYEKINNRIGDMLPGASSDKFIFETTPFKVVLGLVSGLGDDGDGDGSDGGAVVARDVDHAYDLLSEGYEAGEIRDHAQALAGIEGIKKFAPRVYCNSARFHAIHKELLKGDGRITDCYDVASYDNVPFVHLLIKDIMNALDLENEQTCASLFLSGDTSVSKTGLLKAVVGKLIGQGVVEVNNLESISGSNAALLKREPDLVLLMDDMEFSITANGTNASIASIKGVLEQGNSQVMRGVGCRSGKNFEIRLSTRKLGTCNDSTVEQLLGVEDVSDQHVAAIAKRLRFINVHDYQLPNGERVNICTRMDEDAKRALRDMGKRVTEHQCWPLYFINNGPPHPNADHPWAFPRGDSGTLPPPPQPAQAPPPLSPMPRGNNDDWLDDLSLSGNDGSDGLAEDLNGIDWFALGDRISGALRHVAAPGNVFTSTEVVTRLSSHEMFMSVVTKIKIAFDGRWNSETRDRLVDDIAYKIPDLDSGYFLKHMIRSVSYVYELDAIPCRDKFYKMSRHTSDAIQMLENAKLKPSDIIDYMRGDSDGLGVVDERTLVNDDMVLELVICQTKSIWDAINLGNSPVYDLVDLADYNACKGIHYGIWRSTIGDGEMHNGEVGITHSSLVAYNKLNVSLTPVLRKTPLEFDGGFPQTKAMATYFVALMKALVKSGVIAKTPLKNASDIRALYRAKVDLEAKGFHGPDLVGLLVATHRLWTPERMVVFVSNISAAGAASN